MYTHTIDDQNFGVRNTFASIIVIQLNIEMSVDQYNALAGRTNHECTHAHTQTEMAHWYLWYKNAHWQKNAQKVGEKE